MKIDSPDILHKSDVGGVKLNLHTPEQIEAAFHEILENVQRHKPDARINGVLVVKMLKPGVEMLLGVNNDPQFGPMVMVGMGGVLVELFKDVALYPAPLNRSEAMEMLKSLKSYRLLTGYRGSQPCDVDALCAAIVGIGTYAAENRAVLKELDVNPVFVYPQGEGVAIADALVVKYQKPGS